MKAQELQESTDFAVTTPIMRFRRVKQMNGKKIFGKSAKK
jgi:hypothetical protein